MREYFTYSIFGKLRGPFTKEQAEYRIIHPVLSATNASKGIYFRDVTNVQPVQNAKTQTPQTKREEWPVGYGEYGYGSDRYV